MIRNEELDWHIKKQNISSVDNRTRAVTKIRETDFKKFLASGFVFSLRKLDGETFVCVEIDGEDLPGIMTLIEESLVKSLKFKHILVKSELSKIEEVIDV